MWLTQEAIIEQVQLKRALSLVSYKNGEFIGPDGNPIAMVRKDAPADDSNLDKE
jgi:hypothetical protein